MNTTAVESRNTYSEAERRQALAVYASESGRQDLVEQRLAETGLGHVPYKTVSNWATRSKKELYQQIRSEVDRHVRENMGDTMRAVASRCVSVVDESARQQIVALEGGRVPLKELSKVARDFSTPAGIFTDKGELLSGNPTERIRSDVNDLLPELAALNINVIMPTVEQGKGEPEPSPAQPVIDVGDSPA